MMLMGQIAFFSNREDWTFPVMDVIDDDTDAVIDLTGAAVSYGIYDPNGRLVLSGSSADSTVIFPDSTSFQISIPRSSVTSLVSGNYKAGITLQRNGGTTSMFSGSLSILDGNVPA